MKIISLQFAYFYNGLMDRPDQKAVTINSRLNNLFDGSPIILPMADGMPNDFPYVQLKSSNGKCNLNMSPARCDFIVSFPLVDYTEQEVENFKTTVNNLTIELANMKFSRVSIVVKYLFAEQGEDSIKYLSNKFFKKDLSKAFELNFTFNIRRTWLNTKVNDLITVASVKYNSIGKVYNGFEVIRDINTVPELKLNIGKKDVDKFLSDHISYTFERSILEILQ